MSSGIPLPWSRPHPYTIDLISSVGCLSLIRYLSLFDLDCNAGAVDDRSPLALALERAEATAQSCLGFPRDLPHSPRRGRHLRLLLPAYTRRMAIGPGRFDQDTSRTAIAGLGDAAALDPVARGAF